MTVLEIVDTRLRGSCGEAWLLECLRGTFIFSVEDGGGGGGGGMFCTETGTICRGSVTPFIPKGAAGGGAGGSPGGTGVLEFEDGSGGGGGGGGGGTELILLFYFENSLFESKSIFENL
jgi:hypothetical protein